MSSSFLFVSVNLERNADCIHHHAAFSSLSFLATQFRFVLFAEAFTDREEIPASLLVHVPYVSFLTSVFRIRFVDQMHKEEPVP